MENICYNCFKTKPTSGVCPFCGYDGSDAERKYPLALRPGSILNGRYIVGRVLGQGGFGITYLGYDLDLQIRVAVKEFFPLGKMLSTEGSLSSLSKFPLPGQGG